MQGLSEATLAAIAAPAPLNRDPQGSALIGKPDPILGVDPGRDRGQPGPSSRRALTQRTIPT